METKEIDFGPKFDWFEVLEQLKNGTTIDHAEQCQLDYKAGNWTMCACGQLCKLLARDPEDNNAPIDPILRNLGIMFAEHISNKHWTKAFNCLVKIEKRSTQLLEEMGMRVVLTGYPRRFKLAPNKPKKVETKPYAARMAESHGARFQPAIQ